MKQDLAEIKKNGFIPQKQKNRFSLRIKVIGGSVTSGQLAAAARIAEEFGKGQLHLTSRQSIEIPYIKLGDIDRVKAALQENGLAPSCVGPGIRTITACQGSSICGGGLLDSGKIARQVDRKFKNMVLPHKFKIGITGCANDCLKAEENDIGIKGAMLPSFTADNCVLCGVCARICPAEAISVQLDKLAYDQDKCIHCGRCVKRCPKACWQGKAGITLYFGGLFGNKIRTGKAVLPVLTGQDDYLRYISSALAFFNRHGRKGERFAFTIERIGWDSFLSELNAGAVL
jgi:dissimilatory sulfite reductase (desulfoviridin) alpha/beta subunit